MHFHVRWDVFERHGVAAGGEDAVLAQPFGSRFFRAGTTHSGPATTGDEARGIVPVISPAGADQRGAALWRRNAAGREMFGRHDEIERQRLEAFEARDVEEHRVAEDRLN